MRTLTRRLAAVALSLVSIPGFFVATAPAAEAAEVCANRVFSYSLTSKTCVVYLQKLVNVVYRIDSDRERYLGAKRVLDTDGKYGDLTRSAVTNIQRHLQLYKASGYTPAKVDGVTGEQTWVVLCTFGDRGDHATYVKAGCDDQDTSFYWGKLVRASHS